MTQLDASSSVGQWVIEYPQTARIFERLQIDYCCGGSLPLATACQQRGLDLTALTAELARAVAQPDGAPTEDWATASLSALCAHIQRTHHEWLRSELPRLTALINKVVDAHGAHHPELPEVQGVFAALRAELEPHMMKEELILFPSIEAMETAARRLQFPFGTVANPIRMMEHEHNTAGQALTQLRQLTADFQPPDDACVTYRTMLQGLRELEQDLHQHIHKENNILFPRAQALESTLAATPSSP